MKIALVIPGFQSSAADWCIPAFTNLARVLSHKIDLHVFALRYPHRRERYRIGRTTVHALGGGSIAGRRPVGISLVNLWWQFLAEFEREHRRRYFDVVLGIWATESGWLATTAARRAGLPCAVHIAGGELRRLEAVDYGNWGRGLSGWMVRRTLAQADMLLAPSAPIVRALRRRGVDMTKVRRWGLGVDTSMFSPSLRSGRPPGSFTFVGAGSLIPVKGHELTLTGLAHLRGIPGFEHVRLRMVGEGPLRQRLEDRAQDLGLTGYVSFDGEVEHSRLPELFGECDAFVLGSHHEAQCMALLEGMACGLPWVAPAVGAALDAASVPLAGKSGVIVSGRNAPAMARAMAELVELPAAARAQWGASAREWVVQRYELISQSDALLDHLRELTRRGSVRYSCATLEEA